MNKLIIDKYRSTMPVDHEWTLKDFYIVYAANEREEGRTPISFYNYKASMDRYVYYIWKIVIRCNYIFQFMYTLGSLKVTQLKREDKAMFTFKWIKKKRTNIKNIDLYRFKEFSSKIDNNFGRAALRAWNKETRYSNDLSVYSAFIK